MDRLYSRHIFILNFSLISRVSHLGRAMVNKIKRDQLHSPVVNAVLDPKMRFIIRHIHINYRSITVKNPPRRHCDFSWGLRRLCPGCSGFIVVETTQFSNLREKT